MSEEIRHELSVQQEKYSTLLNQNETLQFQVDEALQKISGAEEEADSLRNQLDSSQSELTQLQTEFHIKMAEVCELNK